MLRHELRVVSRGHRFLEAPRWHADALWLSDFFTERVVRLDDRGVPEVVATVPGRPSGIGFLADGRTLVVSQLGMRIDQIAPGGAVSTYADLRDAVAGPVNDLLVTGDGHAYAGAFGFAPGEEVAPARLVHVDPAGGVHVIDDELMFPNGMAITPDGETLLVAETLAHRITAFRVGADGELSDRRTWAALGPAMHPDGIALDSDGGIWFGNALTTAADSGFYRVEEGGRITDAVPVEGAWAVACAFGGPALDTLYLTCSETTREGFARRQSTSYVASAQVGRTGAATYDKARRTA